MPKKRTKPLPNKRLSPEEKLIQSSVEHMDVSKADTSYFNPNQEYYDNFKARERIPIDARGIEKIGRELIEWASTKPEATRVTKFFNEKGIELMTYHQWTKKYPSFKRDYEMAKLMIADRLFDGVLTRVYSERLVHFQMPMLDEEWKQETIRVSNLKEDIKIAEMSRPLNIIMQDYRLDKPKGSNEEDSSKKE